MIDRDKLLDLINQDTPESLLAAMRSDNIVIPGVSELYDVDEPITHHPEGNSGHHLELVLHQAWLESKDLPIDRQERVRLGALFHDCGKAVTGFGRIINQGHANLNWIAFRENNILEYPEPLKATNGEPSHAQHDKIGAKGISAIGMDLELSDRTTLFCEIVAKYHMRIHGIIDDEGSLTTGMRGLRRLVDRLLSELPTPELRDDLIRICRADARGRLEHEHVPYPQADVLAEAIRIVTEARSVDADETRALKASANTIKELAAIDDHHPGLH